MAIRSDHLGISSCSGQHNIKNTILSGSLKDNVAKPDCGVGEELPTVDPLMQEKCLDALSTQCLTKVTSWLN
uniref:Ovule protein n=1 Tax=Steinernema glaseri TaxID=37863 RepID=A0A1I8A8B6_9BILA